MLCFKLTNITTLEAHFKPYCYYWPILFNWIIFYQIMLMNEADKNSEVHSHVFTLH
jgi:hypothetical protein